jgi:peptidoglycan/LPS O-acetylase OafA/YrhL
MAGRRRLDQVDAMRPVKQAGVISTHTVLYFAPAAASVSSGAALLLLHVSREGFFFVSACMLTYAYADLRPSDPAGLRRFYWRRFFSVGIPYLCWTVVYFLYLLPQAHYASPAAALRRLAGMAATGYYQLYFLLVIMQFYLVFPALLHWRVLPPLMITYGQQDALSYLLYLVGGGVVAFHLDEVHRWVCRHARLIVALTVAAALAAEGVYFLARAGVTSALGSGDDPFQPIVIPFNVGAITCVYLAGVALVRPWRSRRAKAAVRSGSDNAYGVYLSHMLFITALIWLGWERLSPAVPWPLLCLLTVAIVYSCGVALTAVLARTPLAVPLTGRARQPWSTLIPPRGGRDRTQAVPDRRPGPQAPEPITLAGAAGQQNGA